MATHLDSVALHSLASEGAQAAEAERAHLAECGECSAAFDALRRDEVLFEELRSAAREESLEADPSELLARDSIPGHELLGELHRGGQGVVYVAREVESGRRVALKLLARGRTASSRDQARFEREVELAGSLRHPHVVRVLASGSSPAGPWYTMELIEGRRLDLYLEELALDRPARLALFGKIAGAVACAHRSGIIHRDLKPANVIVDADGEPHVLDFGLAIPAASPNDARLTASGEFLGTLAYAAPEQVSGERSQVDTRTDVHALGLMLYEMLTGRLPWDVTGGVGELVRRITHSPPNDPRKLSPEVDAELATILATALEKDPDRRYASAHALQRDVERAVARQPLEARPRTVGYVLRLAAGRHRLALLVAGGVLILALLLGGAALNERLRADRFAERAALARELLDEVAGAGGGIGMGVSDERLAVLEEAGARLDAALDGAPDVQAAVQLAIGEAHAARLRYAEAAVHLRHAVERFRASGDEAPLSRALESLALVLAESGAREAIALAEEAHALRLEQHGSDDPRSAIAKRTLAYTLLTQLPERREDEPRAHALIDEAERSLSDAYGPDHPEVAAAMLLRPHRDTAIGERLALYERALAILERHPGEAPRTLECLDGYAWALQMAERFDEAEVLLARSLTLTLQTFGEAHTAEVLHRRGTIEQSKGELANSERWHRNALAVELDAWTRRRPEFAARLSPVLHALNAPEELPPYVEAFEALRELRGVGDFRLSSWMNELARLELDRGRATSAEALTDVSLTIHCRVYGEACPNRRETLRILNEDLGGGEAAR